MEKNNSKSGVGLLGMLQIAFIVLKLCGVIAWSWWLVLIPVFVHVAVTLGVITYYVVKQKKLETIL